MSKEDWSLENIETTLRWDGLEALAERYPKLCKEDIILSTALGQIAVANKAIEKRVEELNSSWWDSQHED